MPGEPARRAADYSAADPWEWAHTDFAAPARRGPSGLAHSPGQWRDHLVHHTPNGHLLQTNAMFDALASTSPIRLMHTTTALDAIRRSGQLYQAAGCLVGALYCAPLTAVPAGLRPHNLGAHLLATKTDRDVLVIEIDSGAPSSLTGVDYLRLGRVHLDTYRAHAHFLTADEQQALHTGAVRRIVQSAGVLDLLSANACGAPTAASVVLDQVAAAVGALPFLGYLYFEVLAEYLMLHSTSAHSRALADIGEFNNHLYKRAAFAAVDSMGTLFDLALFQPNHAELLDLVGRVEPGLVPGAAEYVRARLAHLFAASAFGDDVDASAVTFRGATDLQTVADTSPSLLGQTLFRHLRAHPRYPQLFPIIEQAKATAAASYWNRTGIATPFNAATPKGEVGINLAYPHGSHRVWTAEVCHRGLVHPRDELDITFVPRLTDLRSTALGRAAFTYTPPRSVRVPQHLS